MANNNQFVRRLRRELTGSPKKAAMLGLLVVVAIWFWAPLVGKWIGKKEDDVVPAPAAEAGAAVNSNLPITAAAANSNDQPTPPLSWQKVLKGIRSDPQMQPYEPQLSSRDPFSRASSKMAAREVQKVETPAVPPVTPEQAGIVLNSIVVGPRAKTVLINGRAYHEQQTIVAPNGHDRFVLLEIRQRSIVLDRNGERFETKLHMMEAAAFEE